MTNKEKKLKILRLLDHNCKLAYRDFLAKKAELAGEEAAKHQWDKEQPEDGVGCFSMNPHSVEKLDRVRIEYFRAERLYQEYQEVCDYAMESLVG